MHKCEKCRDSGLVSTGPEGTYGCTNCECTRGENSLVIANEPQCEPAIMVDGKIITVDDYQALQAENERLKSRSRFLNTAYGVNKLKADAVRDAIESAVSVWAGDIGDNVVLVDSLIEYANKLESGDEKHENI